MDTTSASAEGSITLRESLLLYTIVLFPNICLKFHGSSDLFSFQHWPTVRAPQDLHDPFVTDGSALSECGQTLRSAPHPCGPATNLLGKRGVLKWRCIPFSPTVHNSRAEDFPACYTHSTGPSQLLMKLVGFIDGAVMQDCL